uniref:Uncharacterized protein n=1 Tax=Physcomitrium patens TaxID=3218 RepID=A0A7I4B5V6_PHYPA
MKFYKHAAVMYASFMRCFAMILISVESFFVEKSVGNIHGVIRYDGCRGLQNSCMQKQEYTYKSKVFKPKNFSSILDTIVHNNY